MSKNTAVSVRTFTEVLRVQIKNNARIGITGAFACQGTHGIGKTEGSDAVVKQLRTSGELDCNYYTFNASEIADDDFCGYPLPQVELCSSADGKCIWIEVRAAEIMMKAGYVPTGNYRSFNAKPDWVANLDPNKITVIFADDFTRG